MNGCNTRNLDTHEERTRIFRIFRRGEETERRRGVVNSDVFTV